MTRAWIITLVVACGAPSAPSAPSAPTGLPAAMIAGPAGADDPIVATVGGRPVYGSCVAAQVARDPRLDRRAALGECVDFELLAQAAEARGAGAATEVAEVTHRALVSRLVELDFERRVSKPEDLPAQIEAGLARNRANMARPELRLSQYVRIKVDRNAPSDRDAAARALADRIHAALADETGLLAKNVEETARRLGTGAGFELETNRIRVADPAAIVPAYQGDDLAVAQALFAIPEVGRVSPVFRTAAGWDFVLLEELVPAKVFTREEVVARLFDAARRDEFVAWCERVRAELHIEVIKHPELLGPS
jgi:hypothetical protein